jgi:hypothetical protein
VTWVRTEDSMPLHPKILRLSDGAFRLWENALHFANRATTDGRIEKALIPTLNHHGRWTTKQIAAFVAELVPSLWVDCGDHYQIHDYAHHQYEATKARVESKRASWREKKQRQRDESDGSGRDVPRGQNDRTPGESPGVSSPPSRPVPISSLRSESLAPDTRLLVRQHFGRWYELAKATLWPLNQAKADDVRAVADWADQMAARENLAPEAVIERVMRHFAADEFTQKAGSPWAHFAKNYANYWQPPKPKAANTNGRTGRILY